MNNDRLYIVKGNEKTELQIDNSKDIEISFAVPMPEQLSIALADVSQHINLVSNAYNQSQINDLSNPNSYDKKGHRSSLIKAELHTKTGVLSGSLKIDNSVNKGRTSKHRAIFKTGNTIWTDLAKVTYINELDLGQELYEENRVLALIADDDPYNGIDKVWYSLKDYGAATSIFGVDSDNVTPIMPDVYSKAIIESFFELSGYSIDCPFFETNYFKRMTHPATARLEDIVINDVFLSSLISELSLSNQTYNTSTNGLFVVVSGANNIDNLSGYTKYNSPATSSYLIKIDYDATTNLEAGFLILYVDNILIEPIELFTGVFYEETIVKIPKGSVLTFKLNKCVINSMQINISAIRSDFALQDGVSYNVSSVLPAESFADYLKGHLHLFGLISATDNSTKTVIIAPYSSTILPTGEYIEGFYSASHTTDNWSNKVLETQPVNYNDENKRFFNFTFRKDNDDKSYTEKESPYSQIVDLKTGNSDTKDVSNPIFCPTLMTSKASTSILTMPTFKGSGNENNYSFGLRILYKVGNISGVFKWMNANDARNNYPFSAQFSIEHNVNIGFQDNYNNNPSSLIQIFYKERIQLMKQKTTWIFDVEINNGTDKIELIRRKKYIKGQIYYLYKIERLNISKGKSVARCYFRKK